MNAAAIVAVVLLAVVAVFQIALALGFPMGEAAWGGRNPGRLPLGWRAASAVVGVVVYPLIALFVLASAGIVETDWLPGISNNVGGRTGMWILSAFFGIGTLANFASRSRKERIWGPVSGAIAICCAIVALAL